MFNTILLALDGSEASERAIPLAEVLRRAIRQVVG